MPLKETDLVPGSIVFVEKEITSIDESGNEKTLIPQGAWGLLNSDEVFDTLDRNNSVVRSVNVLFDQPGKFWQVSMDHLTTEMIINPDIKYDLNIIFSHMLFLEKMNRMNIAYHALTSTEHRQKAGVENRIARDMLTRHLLNIYINAVRVTDEITDACDIDWGSIRDEYYGDLLWLGMDAGALSQLDSDILTEANSIEKARASWGLRKYGDGTVFDEQTNVGSVNVESAIDDKEIY